MFNANYKPGRRDLSEHCPCRTLPLLRFSILRASSPHHHNLSPFPASAHFSSDLSHLTPLRSRINTRVEHLFIDACSLIFIPYRSLPHTPLTYSSLPLMATPSHVVIHLNPFYISPFTFTRLLGNHGIQMTSPSSTRHMSFSDVHRPFPPRRLSLSSSPHPRFGCHRHLSPACYQYCTVLLSHLSLPPPSILGMAGAWADRAVTTQHEGSSSFPSPIHGAETETIRQAEVLPQSRKFLNLFPSPSMCPSV